MEKKKIALAGARGHMDKFARLITSYPESRVAAVWDNDISRGKELAALYGCPFYEDYQKMVGEPALNAVVLCTMNVDTPVMALQAVNAGKSLYVEKPLCLKKEDAYAIKAAVKKMNVKFFMTDPFVEPTMIWAKDFLKSGRLGKLLSVHVRFVNASFNGMSQNETMLADFAKAMQGGMMVDTGNHPIHALTYLLGKPEKIYGQIHYTEEKAEKYGYDTMSYGVFSYPDNVTALLEIGCVGPSYTNRIEICCTNGTIIDDTFGLDLPPRIRYTLVPEEERTAYGDRNAARYVKEWINLGPEDLPEAPDDHIRYFVRMLAEDIPNDRVGVDPKSTHGVGIDQAVEMVEISEAFHQSAKEGREIQL